MTPKPVAIGLTLCGQVIVEKDTGLPSTIGMFTGLAVDQFPSGPQRFSVYSVLTDAQGRGTIRLVVFRLDEHWLRQEEVFAADSPIHFPDRFAVVNVNVRLRQITFPAAGTYERVLFVDADEVAHRRFRVYQGRP